MVTTRFTKKRALIALLALPLALAACTDGDGGNDAGNEEGGGGGGSDFTFAVVTHASAGDAFWDVVQNGADAAAEDLGVEVTYQGSGEPDDHPRRTDRDRRRSGRR